MHWHVNTFMLSWSVLSFCLQISRFYPMSYLLNRRNLALTLHEITHTHTQLTRDPLRFLLSLEIITLFLHISDSISPFSNPVTWLQSTLCRSFILNMAASNSPSPNWTILHSSMYSDLLDNPYLRKCHQNPGNIFRSSLSLTPPICQSATLWRYCIQTWPAVPTVIQCPLISTHSLLMSFKPS